MKLKRGEKKRFAIEILYEFYFMISRSMLRTGLSTTSLRAENPLSAGLTDLICTLFFPPLIKSHKCPKHLVSIPVLLPPTLSFFHFTPPSYSDELSPKLLLCEITELDRQQQFAVGGVSSLKRREQNASEKLLDTLNPISSQDANEMCTTTEHIWEERGQQYPMALTSLLALV